MFFEEGVEGFAEDRFGRTARLHAAELAFGLAFELDFAQFYRHNGGQAFEHVVACKCVAFLTVRILRVKRARECGLESSDMCAALGVVDVVGECGDARRDVVDILEGDLYMHAVLFFLHIKDGLVYGLEVMILERDKAAQTTLEVKGDGGRIEPEFAYIKNVFVFYVVHFAEIKYRNAETFDQIRLLAHVGNDGIPVQFPIGKY